MKNAFYRFAWVPPCPTCGQIDKVEQNNDSNYWWYCNHCKRPFNH